MKFNFKTKEDAAISLMVIISLVVLVAGGIYVLTIPKKQLAAAKILAAQHRATETLNTNQRVAANDSYKAAKAKLLNKLWPIKAEEIAPTTLNTITKMASTRHLKIQSFRPQRTVSADGVDRIPFQFQVDGPYASVVQLAQDIEQSGEKLTVDMIQLTESDGNTNSVTATIQVSAYHASDGGLDV